MKHLIAIFAVLTMWATGPALADHVAAGSRGMTDFYCETEADALRAWTFATEAEAMKWAPDASCYVVNGVLPLVIIKYVGLIYDPMKKRHIEIYKCNSPEGIVYTGYPAPEPKGEPV